MQPDVLSILVSPVSRETFLRDYWGKRHLHASGGTPDRYRDVIREEDIDAVFQSGYLPAAFVNVTRSGEFLPIEDWSEDEVSSRGYARIARAEQLLASYRFGNTIILNKAFKAIPRLASACQRLAQDFNTRTGANIYITPPGSQGFPRHEDEHEVMVLLVSGAKTFHLYPDDGSTVVAPLQAGDFLYIPRGLPHEARTMATASVHVTIGFHALYAFQLLEELAAAAKRNSRFQTIVPSLGDDPTARAEFWQSFTSELGDLIAAFQPESVAAERSRLGIHGQYDPQAGRFIDHLRIHELRPESVCAAREGTEPRFEAAKGTLTVSIGKNRVTVPEFLRSCAEELLNGEAHQIGGIRGMMSDAGRVSFVRPFVEAGLLRILEL